jgi:hypothetical protein
VGYQLIYNPWLVPIADDKFSEVTGWESNTGSSIPAPR